MEHVGARHCNILAFSRTTPDAILTISFFWDKGNPIEREPKNSSLDYLRRNRKKLSRTSKSKPVFSIFRISTHRRVKAQNPVPDKV
jgi:hypothetical protein